MAVRCTTSDVPPGNLSRALRASPARRQNLEAEPGAVIVTDRLGTPNQNALSLLPRIQMRMQTDENARAEYDRLLSALHNMRTAKQTTNCDFKSDGASIVVEPRARDALTNSVADTDAHAKKLASCHKMLKLDSKGDWLFSMASGSFWHEFTPEDLEALKPIARKYLNDHEHLVVGAAMTPHMCAYMAAEDQGAVVGFRIEHPPERSEKPALFADPVVDQGELKMCVHVHKVLMVDKRCCAGMFKLESCE